MKAGPPPCHPSLLSNPSPLAVTDVPPPPQAAQQVVLQFSGRLRASIIFTLHPDIAAIYPPSRVNLGFCVLPTSHWAPLEYLRGSLPKTRSRLSLYPFAPFLFICILSYSFFSWFLFSFISQFLAVLNLECVIKIGDDFFLCLESDIIFLHSGL